MRLRPRNAITGVGEEISLRPFTLLDVTQMTQACQDPEISKWTAAVPFPCTEKDARSWIAAHEDNWQKGSSAQFAIVTANGDVFLGSLGISPFDWDQLSATIGYWVAAPERNRGVATAALRTGVRWVFDDLGFIEIELVTLIGNGASERVAIKAGFEFVEDVVDHCVPTAPGKRFHVKKWKRSSR
jgi:RimJ/RimL family protein N-acetyltransferase